MRYFVFLILALACVVPAHAVDSLAPWNGWCEQGGWRVTVNGVQSTERVQRSFAACTVTVYAHGTLTPSPLFSDATGTIPLYNPFTATSTGSVQFYAADGRYDVQFSGAGIITPFTITDIHLCFACTGGGGGGGGGTPGGSTTQLQYNNAGAFGGTSSATYDSTKVPGEVDLQNVNNVMYVTTAWTWSQTPSGSLTASTPATVTLTPCPAGIDGRDNIGVIGITGVGTPEPVKLTGGGSCRPGLASGTINFTPANNHSAGYTIGSASSGIYEAMAASHNWTGTGGSGNTAISLKPTGAPVANGNVTYAYAVMGRIIPPNINQVINGNNAVLACTTRDACISIESTLGTNVTIRDLRFASNLDVRGWAISQTECAADLATIHTSVAHGIIVGDMVDVQRTDDSHYWGGSVSRAGSQFPTFGRVTAVTANTVTYPDTNCGTGVVGGSRALANTPGYINILNASIYTNESNTTLENMNFAIPGGSAMQFTGHFNNHVVVMNDQSFRWIGSFGQGLANGDGTGNCTNTNPYCGSMAYFPGSFTFGPSVAWLKNLDFSMGCHGNGLTAYNGNTVDWTGGISQAQAQWAMNTGIRRGGFGNVTFTDAYIEAGVCTNPDTNSSSSAGLIAYGRQHKWSGGEGPQGVIPTFVTGGATTYYYYLMTDDGSGNKSAPIYFGLAKPTTNTFDIYWPRVQPATAGTAPLTYTNPTYTLIRSTSSTLIPYTAGCAGGSTSACGSIAVAAAQCAGLMCHFTDNVTVSTSAVTIPAVPVYEPPVSFWPGPVVVQGGGRFNYDTSDLIGTVTSMAGNATPQVFSALNAAGVQRYSWGQSLGGSITLLDEPATGGSYLNTKGRLNLNRQSGNTIPLSSIITLVDSDPSKTLSTSGNRPLMDANDTYIGNDVASAAQNAVGLTFGAPASISNYIGSLPDGVSWKERLTSSLKTFNIRTLFVQPMISLLSCSGCGPFDRTTAPINDTFIRSPGAIGANWTLVDGTWQITTGPAFSTTYAYYDTITVDTGVSRAAAYYSAVSFTADQYAQATIVPANNILGICVRMAAAAPITAYCFTSGSNAKTVYKFVAGATTVLNTAVGVVANGSVIKLSINGSLLTAYIDGVVFYQTTDTAITTGSPGIYGQLNIITTSAGLSNFYAGNAGFTAIEDLNAGKLTLTGLIKAANTVRVATNFTTAANTNLQTITGLTWNLPAVATSYSFHCALSYSQGTANAAVAFGIQAATNAPTNIFANGTQQITVGPPATTVTGTLATLSTTTATAIVTGTPGATATNYVAELDGTIENPASVNVINIMTSTATAADAVTVLRGSYCSITP